MLTSEFRACNEEPIYSNTSYRFILGQPRPTAERAARCDCWHWCVILPLALLKYHNTDTHRCKKGVDVNISLIGQLREAMLVTSCLGVLAL